MGKNNTRGILLSMLIGALMVAGILAAGKAAATPQDDLEYFNMLENQGLVITNQSQAKATGYAICNELASGTGWQSIMRTLMGGGEWDMETAATVFATAVVVYCPELKPDLSGGELA